jgi:hypothetical protein
MSILEKLGEKVIAEVKAAKDSGCVIEHILLGDTDFIYRSLNRQEWKVLQRASLDKAKDAEGNVDPMKVVEIKDESEDAVVMKALIYPKHESASELQGYPAGYISRLADHITVLSGFGENEVEPQKL